MDATKRDAYAKHAKEILFQKQLFAERRGCELADEFTRLEVQIAAILFAFVGLFVDKLANVALLIKSIYITAVFFVILSLVLGLLHLKRKETWWDSVMTKRVTRIDGWDKVMREENTSFEEGLSYDRGVKGGEASVVRSPAWTWILQTISLAIAIALLYAILIAFIFGSAT